MAILSIGELLGMGPSELSGLIPYSGLEYSGTAITGISGSAIGGVGGVPESSVSAIASSYAESAASSKVDQSAFDNCCSAVNTALSGISAAVSGVTGQTGNYIDWSSSGVFQPAGNYQTAGDYAYNSALTAYQPTGDYAYNSSLTAYQPAGDYAYNSSLSGKLDNSASSTWYPMEGNPSGFLTEHQSLSGYATEAYVDSSVSGKQDISGMSAYATTGDLSSKLDASAVNFDGDSSHVTGISGVPLSAQGGGGDYVEKSAMEVKIGSANIASAISFTQGSGNSASSNSFAQGYANSASSYSFAQGIFNGAAGKNSFAQGYANSASSYSFAQGHSNSASDRSFAQGEYNRASGISFAQGYYNTASDCSFAQGYYNSAINTAAVFGRFNLHGDGSTSTGNSAAFVIGDGTSQYAHHDLMLVTKDGEITMYSSTADTAGFGIVSSIKGKLDVSSVNFNGDSSYVTGISGVPLNAQGGGGNYVEKSALEVTIGSANTARDTAVAQGTKNSAYWQAFAQGHYNLASSNSFAQGYSNGATSDSFAQGHSNDASSNSFAQGEGNAVSSNSFAQGYYNRASGNSFAWGMRISAINSAVVFGTYNLHGNGNTSTGDSAAFVIGDGTSTAARHDLMLVTKNGEITMYSSTADTVGFGIVSSIKAISGAAGGNKLDVSSVNFNGDSSYVTGISGIPLYVPVAETIPLTSTDGSVMITNQGTYADVIVTGTTGDLMVSGISILALYRWATSQGYQP